MHSWRTAFLISVHEPSPAAALAHSQRAPAHQINQSVHAPVDDRLALQGHGQPRMHGFEQAQSKFAFRL